MQGVVGSQGWWWLRWWLGQLRQGSGLDAGDSGHHSCTVLVVVALKATYLSPVSVTYGVADLCPKPFSEAVNVISLPSDLWLGVSYVR